MRTVNLGRSGIRVPALGLGGIQFSKITRAQTVKVIRTAMDLGVTFLETAYRYFDSEEEMGHALRGRRENVVLASKNGARDGKTFTRNLNESLRRLQTDMIDVYQLHGADSEESLAQAMEPRGAVEAAEKAIRQGKIRSLGITSHSLELSVKALELDIFDSFRCTIPEITCTIPVITLSISDRPRATQAAVTPRGALLGSP